MALRFNVIDALMCVLVALFAAYLTCAPFKAHAGWFDSDPEPYETVVDLSDGDVGENLRAAFRPYNLNRDRDAEFDILITGTGRADCTDLAKTLVQQPVGGAKESPVEYLYAARPEVAYRKARDMAVVGMDHTQSVGKLNIRYDAAHLTFTPDVDGKPDAEGFYHCECDAVAIQRIGAEFELGRFLGTLDRGPRRSGDLEVTVEGKCGRTGKAGDELFHPELDAGLNPVAGLDVMPYVVVEWDDGSNKVTETGFRRDYRSTARADRLYTVGLVKSDSFATVLMGATFHGFTRPIQFWGHMAIEVFANRFHWSAGPPIVTGDWRRGPNPSFFEYCASGHSVKHDPRHGPQDIICNMNEQQQVNHVSGLNFEANVIEGSDILGRFHGDVQLYQGPRQHIESTAGTAAFDFNATHCLLSRRVCTDADPCAESEGACVAPPAPVWNGTPMLNTNDISWCNRREIECPEGADCSCDRRGYGE